jgi:glycerol-3-phosphate dehydrogenase
MNRKENLIKLQQETFDVCIIGGGASGLGCALDAQLRGMKVCLIEKEDFASGTSSRSTKLIHGGVRYLEQAFKNLDLGQLKQVRHGLAERHILLRNAPHLAHPLGLITPVFNWFEAFYFSVGLKLYGLFAVNDSLPKANWLSKKNTLARIPTLSKSIHSSVMYYDGQLDDARFCVALAKTANRAGTTLANHTSVLGFEKDTNGKLSQAVVQDNFTAEKYAIKAKVFINCTGPYADSVRLMANDDAEKRLKPSKGVHIIVPKSVMSSDNAMLIPKTKDGRVVFVVPFENQVMIGTTDDAYDKLEAEPILEAEEVDFLIETTNRFFETDITPDQVQSGFGGLRPLLGASNKAKSTKTLLRDHEVEHDESSDLISLMGGKWTTYRVMAKDTIDKVADMLQNTKPCLTDNQLLVGAENFDQNGWKDLLKSGLDEDIAKHLNQKYGNESNQIIAILAENEAFKTRLHPDFPFIEAEVIFHVRTEMATKPRDVLANRIRFELTNWKATVAALPKVCSLMQAELNWSDTEKNSLQSEYMAQLMQFIDRSRK